MSGAKHTPTPWRPAMMNSRLMNVLPHRIHGFVCQVIGGSDGQMVAHAHGRTEKECEANARLIAAAPELLEQCRLFERVIEYQIKVATSKGDDEGARLQQFTLHQLREVLLKAEAK